ncbi:MAG: DUF3788 family protein [Paludibacteraceae bacterium]
MSTENDMMLLREAEIVPTDSVLEKVLGTSIYAIYGELLRIVVSEYGLQFEWRYYNDGKAWLCKITNKKKTILWLSVWHGFLKTSFYFTQKSDTDIQNLPISTEIKINFSNIKAIGKLKPLVFNIGNLKQLTDLSEIVKYKKSLK